MEVDEAARFIGPAVHAAGGTWADLGAGSGTFTRALASLLGTDGHVLAVERDPARARELERVAGERRSRGATVDVVRADFTRPLALPLLDGVLLANALHFVPE